MRKPYTMSEKRLVADKLKSNWPLRLEIWRLHNFGSNAAIFKPGMGWTFEKIAELFRARGMKATRSSVQDIYRKIANMTMAEVEKEQNGA